jgi:hypothetical protein
MDTYERHCRRLLRAYPIRWRERRGDELIGTLLDLAEPGQRYPSPRGSFDVVRAGLLTRWREHPPLGHWLLYRLAGKRLPSKWRMWTRDDILGWGLLVYQAVLFLLSGALGGLGVALFAEPGYNEPRLALLSGVVVGGIVLAVYVSRRGLRRQSLCRQGFHPDENLAVER